MIRLTGISETIEIETSSVGLSTLSYDVSFVDITASDDAPSEVSGVVSTTGTAATSILVSAPAASVVRQISWMNFFNTFSATIKLVVKKDVANTDHILFTCFLKPGERAQYTSNLGFAVFDISGSQKTTTSDSRLSKGRSNLLLKVGTALEAIGVYYCFAKDSGVPGAWLPGTPGLAGRATNGLTAADSGCIPLWAPDNAGLYLDQFSIHTNNTSTISLWDVLWVNSGIVETTITAQAINSVAFPARDLIEDGSGKGVVVGILVKTTTANAAAIANTTLLSYTNQDGISGRVSTLPSFPATAVVGTVVWFPLQQGDTGVRSIQSITLGTSYVTLNSVALIAARQIVQQSNLVSNTGTTRDESANILARKVGATACLIPFAISAGTTPLTIQCDVGISER
jgi:hypothetical protein